MSSSSNGHQPARVVALSALMQLGIAGGTALARPEAPTLVCKTYPSIPDCMGRTPSCTTCHDGVDPPSWNAYGARLKEKIAGADFVATLPTALRSVESEDADQDGLSNLGELERGTLPGNAASVPMPMSEAPAAPNADFRLDGYDPAFAYRRVLSLYCGRSPTYDEVKRARSASEDDASALIHDQLSTCLQSSYWTEQVVPRFADKRIKPVAAVGPDTQIQAAGYRIVIGNYEDDYRLWTWVLTGDRDLRELLTAQYHMRPNAQGVVEKVEGVIPKPSDKAIAGGQPLDPQHRAGMITTQWFFAYNTMFAALPRVAAAQAYRAYLGTDISLSQGLIPVAGEPTDVDDKGVDQPRCANCHSTLDPLAYAFARYIGISTDPTNLGNFGNYDARRPASVMPAWDDAKQKPSILGQQVSSLVEWAHVAAESDEFKRNLALIFFHHALGRDPLPAEEAEFSSLWRSMVEDRYSANKLIHRLVDTLCFGAP